MRTLGIFFILSMLVLLTGAGCGVSSGAHEYPEGFSTMNDTAKIRYLMGKTTPDSVARFICIESLKGDSGLLKEGLNTAVLFAYINYKGEDKKKFGVATDEFPKILATPEKIKLIYLAGKKDPLRLGFKMGKEYTAILNSGDITLDDINEEMGIIKDLCDQDKRSLSLYNHGLKTAFKEAGADSLVSLLRIE